MAFTSGAFAPKLQFARPARAASAPAPDERKPLSRDAIVRAAIERLAVGGEEAMGINKLARSLGVKPPSLYNHVDGATDLRRAVAIEGWRRLYDELARCEGALDAHDALRGIALAWRAFAMGNPNLYRLMASVELDDDDPDFAPVSLIGWEIWMGILDDLGFEGDSASRALQSLRASLHGFLILESTRRRDTLIERRDDFLWMVDALAEDYARRGARAARGEGAAC